MDNETKSAKEDNDVIERMSYADKKLAGSVLKIRATRTLTDLFRVYEIEKARIYDCGNWKHINALWEAYHSHIGCV